jgi:hypothetical protein
VSIRMPSRPHRHCPVSIGFRSDRSALAVTAGPPPTVPLAHNFVAAPTCTPPLSMHRVKRSKMVIPFSLQCARPKPRLYAPLHRLYIVGATVPSALSRSMPLSVSRGAELKIFSEASLRCAAPPLPLWCLNGSSELRPLPGPTTTPSSIPSSLLTSSNSKSTPVTSGLSHHRQVPITDHRHRRDLNTVSPLLPEPLNPIHRLAIAL